MSDTPLIKLSSAKLVLFELQRQHDELLSSIDGISGKATSLLEWASLAIVVVSTLSMKDFVSSSLKQRSLLSILLPDHFTPIVLLVAALVVYVVIACLCQRVIAPRDFELPVGTSWEEWADNLLTVNEKDAVEQLLAQYHGILVRNGTKADERADQLTRGLRLLPWLIGLLTCLVTHPLWENLLP